MPFVWHANTRKRVGDILKYLKVKGADGGMEGQRQPSLIPVWDELEEGGGEKRWLIDYLRTEADLSCVEGLVVVSSTPVSSSFVEVLRSLKQGIKVYCPYLKTVEDALGMAEMGVGIGAGCAVEEAEKGVAFNLVRNQVDGKWEVRRFDLKDCGMRMDKGVLEEGCGCLSCREPRRHSKGYLHHLWKTGEITGKVLNMSHNLWQLDKLKESL